MKILILTDDMLPGGVAKHTVDLANGLVEKGYEVSVAATKGTMLSLLKKEVNFIELKLLKSEKFVKNYFGIIISFFRLISFVNRKNIEIIHSHKRLADFVGRLIARVKRIPHISTCHSVFSDLKLLSTYGDFTIATCKSIENNLITIYKKKKENVKTIYNGIYSIKKISENEIKEQRKALKIVDNSRVILNIAHLNRVKDHITLLDAIIRIKDTLFMKNVILYIIGFGSEENKIINYINNNGIKNLVKLLPGNSDIQDMVNIAEFCILPSMRESVPYVILEAASVGKPHIATRVGGVPEFVIIKETGILVQPQNPAELADAIIYLLDHPDEVNQLGANAKKRYERFHTYDRFISETIKVYDNIVNNKQAIEPKY